MVHVSVLTASIGLMDEPGLARGTQKQLPIFLLQSPLRHADSISQPPHAMTLT